MQKKKLVVLTGAGISAESGLKTFRDSDGLWEGYDIEQVATPRAWKSNPSLVLNFYNQRRKNVFEAIPNVAHILLAGLQEKFEVIIVTQNIDDLHERAGSDNVLHLHGEILKRRSEVNPDIVSSITQDMLPGELAPDGTAWRPDIVWFEEPVPRISAAAELVRKADIFAVVGTSLVVYPAAGLVNYAPYHIPKFIVDKKIPDSISLPNLIAIENLATAGMKELSDRLLSENF
ncbi:SIR2 family NAD-dependent protein deacylase [Flavihumibacter profundi]|uniref:SIR2 family NAD-dependent protein deacylase n=1 Tax=Flavihumibacter profundi TaxID=2716883 RepID=UPI001CC583B9|nr:Sir2 family NAD-dependent protein deacetylase [Flavihumibacter profundi]MBZ5856168.1 NAD-dependent deacylase [Flavihumibacter profundi]